MHHIATVIYPTPPAPTTSALCDLIQASFPDARLAEVEDGIDVQLDNGRLFVEIDDRTVEALDDEGHAIAPPEPNRDWPDDVDASELTPDAAPLLEGRHLDRSDGSVTAVFGEATRYVHLEGDFADPADVIGLLEVLLRAREDATATDASGDPLPFIADARRSPAA
ncbi:MAG: hypothetical protein CVU56_03250 [Deltaproteobacteria bacterium HGW-Deltaproteobacteria-14]|jgi:hypothetical protein|nr:MAG: hypothetical protein CVU56_03250 [Deltaproteobacteria bacterium HGW-Deltaproteobacteria-14]